MRVLDDHHPTAPFLLRSCRKPEEEKNGNQCKARRDITTVGLMKVLGAKAEAAQGPSAAELPRFLLHRRLTFRSPVFAAGHAPFKCYEALQQARHHTHHMYIVSGHVYNVSERTHRCLYSCCGRPEETASARQTWLSDVYLRYTTSPMIKLGRFSTRPGTCRNAGTKPDRLCQMQHCCFDCVS